MEKVNHTQAIQHIKRAYEIGDVSVFLHGAVGIGKSQIVRECAKQIAKENKLEFSENGKEDEKTFNFRDVRLAQMESVDLRGVPKIEDGKTKWFVPDWLPQNPKSRGILFFDEMNTAFVSVQNASLELVLDRRLGSYHLPEGWMIVSAGNRMEDRVHISEMSTALASRFKHFELQIPTIKDWSAWAMEHGIEPSIVGFLNFKQVYMHKFDEDNKDSSFPNPRAWEFASKSIKGISDERFREGEVASCVGKGVAIEFSAWRKLQDKADLNAILKNPESVTKIKEMSLKFAIVSGLSEKYKQEKKNLEQFVEVCKYIDVEVGFILLGYLRNTDKMAFGKIVPTKVFKEIAPRYGKYFDLFE